MDSRLGANYHLVANQEHINHPVPVPANIALTIADGKTLPILSRGSSVLSINSHSFVFGNILYSPAIAKNLLSVSAFNNSFVEFFLDTYFVKDIPTRQVLYQGQSKDGLYFLPISLVQSFSPKAFPTSVLLWHERLGHANFRVVQDVLHANKISFVSNKYFDNCHACNVSESHKLPFPESNYRAK